MADKKPFLLRISPDVYDALAQWAADEMRSLNGQIEFLLRESLGRAGRAARAAPRPRGKGEEAGKEGGQ